jgi:membrane protease YdiL (CAAX protease family)
VSKKKASFPPLCLVVVLVVLTFAIPTAQCFVGKFASFSLYKGLTSSIFIIFCVCIWYWKAKSLSFFPSSSFWKAFCYLGWPIALGLLIINIQNAPVAEITGQARSPFEVIDVIIFSPIAEELVFRGVMWSIFTGFSRNSRWSIIVILAGSSLLFGVEHLGYWVQSNWPLPVDAIIHALSMVAAGVCFGMFRQTSRSLAVPMVIHMLANGVILLTH